jgi:hypothetical protein
MIVKLYHLNTTYWIIPNEYKTHQEKYSLDKPEELRMTQDMRKEHRRHIIYYLQILEQETGKVIGRLVDITTIGLMIISEKELEPGRKFALRIALPEEFPNATQIVVVGESVWCHKDVNPDYYAIGFKLNPPSENVTKVIQGLIEHYGFVD